MIEKRTMWLLEYSLEVRKVTALYDTEKGKVICNQYCENVGEVEWYAPFQCEQFFDNEDEAFEARDKRIEELREKMKTCRELINDFETIQPCDDFEFEPSDYLGDPLAAELNEIGSLREKIRLLIPIARSRQFNVNGMTINIDKVEYVLWNHKKATLYMDSGQQVTTHSEAEYFVVKKIFGDNISGVEIIQE